MMIDGTSIRFLERIGMRIIRRGCKIGKLPINPCATWRHGACRQAPSQQYCFCVVARDSEDVGDF